MKAKRSLKEKLILGLSTIPKFSKYTKNPYETHERGRRAGLLYALILLERNEHETT